MRNMSFALTTDQILDRSKTVTRRLGWHFLKVGDQFRACRKCMGMKKGEKIERLAVLRVVAVRGEPLQRITPPDVVAEGFPGRDPIWFIDHFCKSMNCRPQTEVNRIEFAYVDDQATELLVLEQIEAQEPGQGRFHITDRTRAGDALVRRADLSAVCEVGSDYWNKAWRVLRERGAIE